VAFEDKRDKVAISGRVDPAIAREIVRLAAEGNRSTSREVAAALAEHVAASSSTKQGGHPGARRNTTPSKRGASPASAKDAA
jgi:hypothetical protein